MRAAVVPLAVMAAALAAGCPRPAEKTATAPTTAVRFTNIAHEAGVDFTHVNGGRGDKRMPETVGSGVALFDYDNDGKLDLLIMNSATWPGDPKPIRSTPKLYRNLGNNKFEDVTEKAGLALSFYGMGVSVADYDNDGWEDLYLTAVGPNHLFHNDHGHFREVTAEAGVIGVPLPGTKMEHKWSSTSAWLDYDKDGKLDLFVCQYVKWSPELDPNCGKNGVRGYCPPSNFEGARCTLFHNQGNGTFRDVSKEIGLLDGAVGKSFGVAIADYNGDGWPDILVANDTWANFLFVNEGGKHFVEKGIESGIAFSTNGKAKAGMGTDVADFRNNGQWGIVVGNFAEEGLSLFEPIPGSPGMFEDSAQAAGVAAPSLLNVTFATFFFDYDLDGWLDIFATNGHVDDIVNIYNSKLTFAQKPLLLHSEGGKIFVDKTDEAGITYKIVGRGAAFGDIDNDGDLDLAVVNNNGKFLLLRNDGGNQNHWIGVKLTGTQSNRDGIGAIVRVTSGGLTQRQYVRSGGSFLSESQRRLTFGLGQNASIDTIEVEWPSGAKQSVSAPKINSIVEIIESKG